ncbi:hypothetical protein [Streptomyces sp. NPDC000880]
MSAGLSRCLTVWDADPVRLTDAAVAVHAMAIRRARAERVLIAVLNEWL